jgi:hypothetical protein
LATLLTHHPFLGAGERCPGWICTRAVPKENHTPPTLVQGSAARVGYARARRVGVPFGNPVCRGELPGLDMHAMRNSGTGIAHGLPVQGSAARVGYARLQVMATPPLLAGAGERSRGRGAAAPPACVVLWRWRMDRAVRQSAWAEAARRCVAEHPRHRHDVRFAGGGVRMSLRAARACFPWAAAGRTRARAEVATG